MKLMGNKMQLLLDNHKEYRGKLYIRGFAMTNYDFDETSYPFYGQWNHTVLGRYHLIVHPLQKSFVQTKENETMILIGHAYNPLTMEYDENEILKNLIRLSKENRDAFWDYFNSLTGIFTAVHICGDRLTFVMDASGMQTTFYAAKGDKLLITSHTMLAADLMDLKKSSYADRLIHYRFFHMLGNSLPADLTQFEGLERATPNFYYEYTDRKIAVHRFFCPCTVQKSRNELIQEAGELMHNSMELITKKWNKPAISLTGGCDSKTTLACANGLYDRFRYFSYESSASEHVDAEAAGKICEAIGVSHVIYPIPEVMPEEANTEIVGEILRWNSGDILDSNPNDIRKRIILDGIDDFDVEVKSWVSEVGRAYYSKRFNERTKFGDKPSGKACTTLYKFFLHDRRLVHETDRVFDRFIQEYYDAAKENPIPWFEQFFWEFRVPSWNGLVITGEHKYSSEITIPYNNRKLLTLLLSVPIEDRIHDTLYTDIRAAMNPTIDATGIAVTNLLHTKRREKFENLYWIIHSHLPY